MSTSIVENENENIIDTENIIQDIENKIDDFLKEDIKKNEKTGDLEVEIPKLKSLLSTVKDELKPIQDFNNQLIKDLQERNGELILRNDALQTKVDSLMLIIEHNETFKTDAHDDDEEDEDDRDDNREPNTDTIAAAITNANQSLSTKSSNDTTSASSTSTKKGKKRSRNGKIIQTKDSSVNDTTNNNIDTKIKNDRSDVESTNATQDTSADHINTTTTTATSVNGDSKESDASLTSPANTNDNNNTTNTNTTTTTTIIRKTEKPDSLINRKKKWTQEKLNDIQKFELDITESPATVRDLYEEFEKKVKAQIDDFEKKFGKGKLSKISKIRTYQRRSALVREIQNYSESHDCTIDEAIQFFDDIVKNNNKTVAWLYNNLAKVLNDYKI